MKHAPPKHAAKRIRADADRNARAELQEAAHCLRPAYRTREAERPSRRRASTVPSGASSRRPFSSILTLDQLGQNANHHPACPALGPPPSAGGCGRGAESAAIQSSAARNPRTRCARPPWPHWGLRSSVPAGQGPTATLASPCFAPSCRLIVTSLQQPVPRQGP